MLDNPNRDADIVLESHLSFTGTARAFAPIWIRNLLLTLVTLGFYRFWAKTRVRQYLWSNTRLWDEPLEYTGTGLELFLGFLVALVVFVLPVTALNLAIQLVAPTQAALAGVLLLLFYIYLFIISNFAVYRVLRYRLTRTSWRGIRGGMATGGYLYGLKGTGYYMLALVTLGLIGPWVSRKLWNMRWNDASYGSQAFSAEARSRSLYLTWLAGLLLALALTGVFIFLAVRYQLIVPGEQLDMTSNLRLWVGGILAYYVLIALFFVVYLATYWKVMIAGTSWGPVCARMTAGPFDWAWLSVRMTALVIFTLGIGAGWVAYFSWKFWMKHLKIDGEPDAETLEQSRSQAPGRGEGLADALDLGAF